MELYRFKFVGSDGRCICWAQGSHMAATFDAVLRTFYEAAPDLESQHIAVVAESLECDAFAHAGLGDPPPGEFGGGVSLNLDALCELATS